MADCFNHSCPFRVNEFSNDNGCECLACPNRCSGDGFFSYNRTLTDEEVSKLTLSVAVRDTSGEWHEVCEALPLHAKYGDLLKYTLEENSEDGYSLKEN